MTTKKESTVKSSEKKSDDPCWKGFVKDGMKTKNGKEVPNCIRQSKSLNLSKSSTKAKDKE